MAQGCMSPSRRQSIPSRTSERAWKGSLFTKAIAGGECRHLNSRQQKKLQAKRLDALTSRTLGILWEPATKHGDRGAEVESHDGYSHVRGLGLLERCLTNSVKTGCAMLCRAGLLTTLPRTPIHTQPLQSRAVRYFGDLWHCSHLFQRARSVLFEQYRGRWKGLLGDRQVQVPKQRKRCRSCPETHNCMSFWCLGQGTAGISQISQNKRSIVQGTARADTCVLGPRHPGLNTKQFLLLSWHFETSFPNLPRSEASETLSKT